MHRLDEHNSESEEEGSRKRSITNVDERDYGYLEHFGTSLTLIPVQIHLRFKYLTHYFNVYSDYSAYLLKPHSF